MMKANAMAILHSVAVFVLGIFEVHDENLGETRVKPSLEAGDIIQIVSIILNQEN